MRRIPQAIRGLVEPSPQHVLPEGLAGPFEQPMNVARRDLYGACDQGRVEVRIEQMGLDEMTHAQSLRIRYGILVYVCRLMRTQRGDEQVEKIGAETVADPRIESLSDADQSWRSMVDTRPPTPDTPWTRSAVKFSGWTIRSRSKGAAILSTSMSFGASKITE